jgi:hypothetical protein
VILIGGKIPLTHRANLASIYPLVELPQWLQWLAEMELSKMAGAESSGLGPIITPVKLTSQTLRPPLLQVVAIAQPRRLHPLLAAFKGTCTLRLGHWCS